jgi:signal transduction histidine kinase
VWVGILLRVLLYFGVARLSLALIEPRTGITAVWPAGGLLLAFLMTERRAYWPALVTGVFLADLLAGLSAGNALPLQASYTLVTCAEGVVGYRLLCAAAGPKFEYRSVRFIVSLFTLNSVLVPALGSLAAMGLARLLAPDVPSSSFADWGVSDGVGVLIVSPTVLAVAEWSRLGRRFDGRVALEVLALIAVIVLAPLLLLSTQSSASIPLPLTFIFFPVLVWAGARFGVAGTASLITAIGCVVATGISMGYGERWYPGDARQLLMLAQGYLGLIAVSGLVLAAAFDERRKVEGELSAAHAGLHALIAGASDAIAGVDRHLRIVAANEAWQSGFGAALGVPTPVGTSMERVAGSASTSSAGSLEHWRHALAGESLTVTQEAAVPGDGVHEYEVTYNPMRDPAGQIVGATQVVRDITDRRQRLEREAQSRRLEAIGRLAGGVAHDFNNIVTGILATASLVNSSLDLDDPRRADLREIERAARRAADLTSQLLAYARRTPVDPRVIDVNDVLRGADRMLHRLLGDGIGVVMRPLQSLWPVRIDPVQLEAALVTLARNSRDAMPHGGTLLVTTGNERVDDGFVARHPAARPGDFVRVNVKDTGTGMPPHVLHRLFEPFFTTKEPGRGAGLGLAMVQGIIVQAGGFVIVESHEGEGSAVSLFLPRAVETGTPRPDGGSGTNGSAHA